MLRKIYGPMKDSNSNEWMIRTNNELEIRITLPVFQKPNILESGDNKE